MKAFNTKQAAKDKKPSFIVECQHIRAMKADDKDHEGLWTGRGRIVHERATNRARASTEAARVSG